MRPINKGEAPQEKFTDYADAAPYLKQRIGAYCSYCEMPILHVPEVEHKVSKSKGGELTAWTNLLLGCKYCNTRKSNFTNPGTIDQYLWPDSYNTALAFTYENIVPQIAEKQILAVNDSKEFYEKAKNLFEMVKLDNIPSKKEKDKRFECRNAAYEVAQDSLEDWCSVKQKKNQESELFKRQLIRTALSTGFFSVWMQVFSDEPEILNDLIKSFPGTERKYYDASGHVKPILRVQKTVE